MLAANQESLRRQTSEAWIQTVLVDDLGRGVEWANQRLGAYAPMLAGDYVWVLDDDDLCTRPTLVEEIAEIVSKWTGIPVSKMLEGEQALEVSMRLRLATPWTTHAPPRISAHRPPTSWRPPSSATSRFERTHATLLRVR